MKRAQWSVLVVLVLAFAPPARAEHYEIRGGDANLVKFESKAPVETFEGKTHAVTGALDLDPAALGDSLDLTVTVQMATLDTGIALRNRDMRENHLHTAKYPTATFHAGRILEGGKIALPANETKRVTLAGALTIHGVTKDVQLPVDLTYDGMASVQIACEFPVALADYAIPRPQFLVMKLGEVQKVSVALAAWHVDEHAPPPAGEQAPRADAHIAAPADVHATAADSTK